MKYFTMEGVNQGMADVISAMFFRIASLFNEHLQML